MSRVEWMYREIVRLLAAATKARLVTVSIADCTAYNFGQRSGAELNATDTGSTERKPKCHMLLQGQEIY